MQELYDKYQLGELEDDLEEAILKSTYQNDKDMFGSACKEAASVRASALEKRGGVSLQQIRDAWVENDRVTDSGEVVRGIEYKIGGCIIPMGYVGPLTIHGDYVKNESLVVPMATNEAALLYSIQRGIKAVNLAGGVHTLTHFDGMTRAPLLEAPDIRAAREFIDRLENDPALLKSMRSVQIDPFVRLEEVEPYQLGTKVFLRMRFKTGDAMGMNGVTKAVADITQQLLKNLPGWHLITISSNLCSDKKSTQINILHHRGKAIETEVFVSNEILQQVFSENLNAYHVAQTVFNKCYLGSALSGSTGGFNVNAANSIAAFFAATGQDMAQVVSSASCFVQAKASDKGLHFTVSLPCIELAAVGGGTMFGTAREALQLLGCDKAGSSIDDNQSVMRLSEIAAAVVTSLELNSACIQSCGYALADLHVKLARGE